jgi:hypothetical protein
VLANERSVPDLYGGYITVITEDAQSARIEKEMLTGIRRQSDPTRRENAQHVPVSEQRHIAIGRTGPGYHPVNARAHLFR